MNGTTDGFFVSVMLPEADIIMIYCYLFLIVDYFDTFSFQVIRNTVVVVIFFKLNMIIHFSSPRLPDSLRGCGYHGPCDGTNK